MIKRKKKSLKFYFLYGKRKSKRTWEKKLFVKEGEIFLYYETK